MWKDRVRWALAVAVIILRGVTLVQVDDPDPNECLFRMSDLFGEGLGVTRGLMIQGKFTLEECKTACLREDGCYLMEYWTQFKECLVGDYFYLRFGFLAPTDIRSYINLCGHEELKKDRGCHHKTTLEDKAIKSSPDISKDLSPDQCAEECNKDQECIGHMAAVNSTRCYIFENIKYDNPLNITLVVGSDWDVSFRQCIPCLDNPCKNGGTCHREDHPEKCCSYICTCPGNLTGRNCDRCPDGYEWDLNDTDKCAKCNRTSISTGVNCTQCPDFMVADELNTECVCAPGHCFDEKQTQCTACPQHQYKPEVGNITSCRNCPDDTGTSGTGHRYCDICVEGMGRIEFSTDSSHITCKPCTGDTHSDEKSNQTCQPCGPGAEGSSTNGNTKCVCEPGFYLYDKQTQCTACPQHQYKPEVGNITSCRNCTDDTGTSGTGHMYCDICVEGMGRIEFSTDSSHITCKPCSGDTYSDEKSNQTCQPCGPGAEGSGTNGNTKCVCKPGFEFKEHVCKECKPNYFKTNPGNWSCDSCNKNSPGSKTSGIRHLKCDICGLGYGVIPSSTSSSDHVQCEECVGKTYSDKSDNQSCYSCPRLMTGRRENNKGNSECTYIILICVGLAFVLLLIVTAVGGICYFNKKKKKKLKKQHKKELKLAKSQLSSSKSHITDGISPETAKSMFLMARDKVSSKWPHDSNLKSSYDSSNWASQYVSSNSARQYVSSNSASQYDDSTIIPSNILNDRPSSSRSTLDGRE